MKNTIIAILIAIVLIGGALMYTTSLSSPNTNPVNQGDEYLVGLIDCFADNGMVIYGSAWCPACQQLVSSLGGYEIIDPVYVECTEEGEKCNAEAKTGYVPEIQINGEVYQGQRDHQSLAAATGCELKLN